MVGIPQLDQEQIEPILNQLRTVIDGIGELLKTAEYSGPRGIQEIIVDAMAGKIQMKMEGEQTQLTKNNLVLDKEWMSNVGYNIEFCHNTFECSLQDCCKSIISEFKQNIDVLNGRREKKIELPEIDINVLVNTLFLTTVLSIATYSDDS